MELSKLYSIAERRHGQIGKDVVHDLFCKFGLDLPSDAYLNTCIQHNRPQPIQERFENFDPFEEEDPQDGQFESTLRTLSTAVNNVRQSYELEVDTFLECHVNSNYKSFSERSGIARSVLEKICKFVKHEILKEFIRIESLD
jgi:hypothetical protein